MHLLSRALSYNLCTIEDKKGNVAGHKGSNLSINTGLQRRKHLNVSVSTSSPALQGDTAQMVSLQEQGSVLESKHHSSFFKDDISDLELLITRSLSKEAYDKIKANTSHFSNARHHKNHQGKDSLAVNSGGTNSTPCKQQLSFQTFSHHPSKEALAVGKIIPTDEQIQDFINKQVEYGRARSTKKNIYNGQKYPDEELDFACLPSATASDPEDTENQRFAWAELEQCMDRFKGRKVNVELNPKSEETSATPASKKHLAETPPSSVGNSKHAIKTIGKMEEDSGLKPVEVVVLDPVQDVTDVSEVVQIKSSSWRPNNKPCEELNLKGGETSVILKDPQYEDISDDEPQLTTKPLNIDHVESSYPACSYEDVSEDEKSQIEFVSVEQPSLPQEPDPNKLSVSKAESYRHMHGQTLTNKEIISREERLTNKWVSPEPEMLDVDYFCPGCAETNDGSEGLLCNKRHLEWQQTHFVSRSPSELEDDETNEQISDDWIVFPLIISELKYEPEDEAQDCLEVLSDSKTENCDSNSAQSKLHWSAPTSPQLEVFDSFESLKTAMGVQNLSRLEGPGWHTPEHEVSYQEQPDTLENRIELLSESEDGYETEDSCDYSPGSKSNYMTVSRHFLASQSIITIDSDTEDESDQNCKMEAGRKRLHSSVSDESEDAPCSPQKRYSHKPVSSLCGAAHEKFQQSKQRSASVLQHHHNNKQLNEMMQDASCDLSHSIEKTGHLTESADTFSYSVHIQSVGQEHSPKENVIVIDSDTDDDSDQNDVEGQKTSFFSSGSAEAEYVPESLSIECESAEEFREMRMSSAEPSQPLHAKPHHTQLKEVMQDTSSNLSHKAEKHKEQIEAKGGFDSFQHTANRPELSEARQKTKELHFGSEDSGNVCFPTKNKQSTESLNLLCGTGNKKPKKMSSEDITKSQPQLVGKKSECSPRPNKPNNSLKHSENSEVQIQGSIETPHFLTRPSMTTPHHKNTQHRKKRVTFMSPPANQRHSKSKSDETKPQQLSLLNQESPSTATGSSSFTSGQRQSSASPSSFSKSGETSTSCSLPKSKHSTPAPRQSSSYKQLSRSYSSPSILQQPSTFTAGPSSATMQLSAKEQVTKHWQNSFYPTRRDRKPQKSHNGLDEDLKTINSEPSREARPGPSQSDRAPRQRHNSQESETPLMKRAKSDAISWTKATNREAPRKRHSVGDGYKWSEKLSVPKFAKGSGW